jgi:DNA-directed RNA polymerase specialized sigma24 family protein
MAAIAMGAARDRKAKFYLKRQLTMNQQQASLLIVDDNEMNLDALSRRLKRRGYAVKAADCGEAALQLISHIRLIWCYSMLELPEPTAPIPPGDPVLASKLRRLVAALPEKPRMIVTLRFQEDLEPSEIAEILEMPVNTVKSHLYRALDLLHEKLNALEKLPV